MYKGCRSSSKQRTIAGDLYQYMGTTACHMLTNVAKHGSKIIYAYTRTHEPQGGSSQEN